MDAQQLIAQTYLPKRAYPSLGSNGTVGYYIPQNAILTFARPLGRRRLIAKTLKALLIVIMLITIGINVIFILDTSHRLQEETSNSVDIDLNIESDGRKTSRHLENSLRFLSIEVLSSQSKVSVSVNGATILEDGGQQTGRGIHVLVLSQSSGNVMAQRVFDTYSPHEDDAMALFLNMVSDSRIIIFAIKDEGTFQMKQAARDLIKRLGSQHVQIIGWRDMWAMVTQKGGKMFGETYSKSSDFSSWGAAVLLKTEVPLVPFEVNCQNLSLAMTLTEPRSNGRDSSAKPPSR